MDLTNVNLLFDTDQSSFDTIDPIEEINNHETVSMFCKICGPNLLFSSVNELTKHCRTQHNGDVAIFSCGFCDSVFNDSHFLVNHLKLQHRSQMEAKCPLCTYVPYRPSMLEDHQLNYHQGAPFYPCSFCTKDFNNISQLQFHERKEHKQQLEELFCHYCSINLEGNDVKIIRQHYKNDHSQLNEYPCCLCDTSFTHVKDLLSHEKIKHSNQLPTTRTLFMTNQFHICPFQQCDFVAQWPKLLRYHVKTVHLIFHCDICTFKFESEDGLENHKKLVHNLVGFYWQCGICKEIIHEEALKIIHQTQAHVGMQHPCKCAVCGQNFSDETSKNQHMKKCHLKENQEPMIFPKEEEVTKQVIEECDIQNDDKQDSKSILKNSLFNIIPEEGKLPYQCKLCLLAFKFYVSLICHIKSIHGNTMYNSDGLVKNEQYVDATNKNRKLRMKIIVKKNAAKRRGITVAK